MNGRPVYFATSSEMNDLKITTNALPGIYFIVISSGNETKTIKLIKE